MSDVESTTDRRRKLADLCDQISSAGSKNDLLDAIDDALGVCAPVGDVATLESLHKRYSDQVDDAERLGKRIGKVAKQGLPQAWVGDTRVLASQVVLAAQRDATQMVEAFRGGAKALLQLADALGDAKKKDSDGRAALRKARTMLGDRDGWFDDLVEKDDEEEARLRARSVASTGVDLVHQAAVTADDAARAAARDLDKWAAEARAGKMVTGDITAADRLMLADTSTGGGDPELNEILTANDLERAGQRMDQLSDQDEAAMERMLARAGTPQERAYLMKSLAAGHSVHDIETFDGKIHGKDRAWLQRHLSPVVMQTDSTGVTTNVDFDGQGWTQGGDGQEGTCVASSTVTARAMADPLYALNLTGGPSGQEDDPATFRKRLIAEQHRLHEEGDGGDDWDGMDTEGQEHIADSTIGSATGDDYAKQDLDDADARRDVLPDIERAVAEGRPVPVDVRGDADEGHAMMIIGQEGDRLEIYNPWGTTTWVTEDDFINGHMDKASDSRLPNADTVFLPQ